MASQVNGIETAIESGASLAARMEARAHFRKMLRAGLQPEQVFQEILAKKEQEIKAFRDRLVSTLQQRQESVENITETLSSTHQHFSEEALRNCEANVKDLTCTHAKLESNHQSLQKAVQMGKQILSDQISKQIAHKDQLEGLKQVAKATNSSPYAQQMMHVGSQLCYDIAKKNSTSGGQTSKVNM